MSEDDDPFENLDPPEDREGDPFERLGDAGPAEEGDDSPEPSSGSDDSADTEPSDGTESRPASNDGTDTQDFSAAGDGTDTADADAPAFEEEFIDEDDPFTTGPSEGRPAGTGDSSSGTVDGEDDPFADGENVFESVDVESLDADEVWESLDKDSESPTLEGSRYVEVSKHRFCEQCEFFSAPPNAHCTHEEAEIIEYLDMETVRLLNCPVVAEQREIDSEE